MKTLSLLFATLFLSVFCLAASKPDPLASLITRIVEDGDAELIKGAMNEKLGFAPNTVAKSITIPHKTSGDGRDHTLYVIIRTSKDGRPEPEALKIGVASGRVQKDGTFVDGYVFKADLKGNLEKAFHNSGMAGHIKPEEMPIDKRKVRKIFEKELEFFIAQKK